MTRIWHTAYKLTTQDHQTKNACQWGKDVTNPHGIKAGNRDLCSSDWYHAYHIPELAVIMNPSHANITKPVLWRAEVRGKFVDDKGLKFGATEMRTVEILPLPVITTTQRVAFSIYLAGTVLAGKVPAWDDWASKWLSGEDRSWDAAQKARRANAAYAAAAAAAAAAADGAAAYAYAAYAASYASAAAAAADAYADAAHALLQDAVAFALTFED